MASFFSRDPFPINKRCLVNCTDVDIPRSVQHILQLGSNFCLPYATIPVKKLITDAEFAIQNSGAPNDDKERIRHRIAGHVQRV